MGDGVPHPHLAACLDAGDDVAHVTGRQFRARRHVKLQHANLVGMVFLARRHELHEVFGLDAAVHNLEVSDDAAERVEHRVEYQCLQRRIGIAHGSRDALHDGAQDFVHTHARLAAGPDYLRTVAAQQVDNLVLHLVGIGALEVALVDDGYNLQIVVDGHVEV